MMKLAIVGATGPTGRELVQQALAAGHVVTAGVRSPKTANLPTNVRLVEADVTRASSLIPLVTGQDAVLCALGSKLSRKPTTLLSGGTKNLVGAMTSAGVRRLMCITGIGAGDSKGHGGFLYDHIIQPLLLSEIYKDKTRQEEVIRRSGLEWTIVRPAMLTNGPATGKFREIIDISGVTAKKISRSDVAAYVLRAVAAPQTVGTTVLITY